MKAMPFILIFLFSINLNASLVKEANESYKNGDYKKAIEIYKTFDNGKNPYIIYNIGNCYYKMNDKPQAFAQYIKAFKILPRDRKIKENMLKLAKENNVVLFSNEIPQILYSIYYFFSEKELIMLFELSFIFFSLFLILYWWKLDEKFLKYILISFLFLSVFGINYLLRKNSIFHSPGVIIKEAEIYSGPKKTFNTIATVPQGKLITILSEEDDFFEVGVREENIKGWVEKDLIIKI